jgi:hypothetical protein
VQGRFWAYHDYLFAHQFPDEHSGLVTGAYLRSVHGGWAEHDPVQP